MSVALNTKHLSSFISEEEYAAIYPQVEAAHKQLEAKNGPGSDFLGWMTLPRDYDKEEFARIKAAAAKIREDSDVLVVAGIGGSYLGARAVVEAVKGMYHNELEDGLKIYFCGNSISPTYLNNIISLCKGKRFSINVISKSGTTTETSLAFRVLRELLEKEMGVEEANKRIYATTDAHRGALKGLADQEGYEEFVVPDDVGGRYSVLSAVGLVPAAFMGLPWEDFLEGAASVNAPLVNDELGKPENLRNHPAWALANWCFELSRHDYSQLIFFTYIPSWASFGQWFGQLWAESLGKNGKGTMPLPAVGVTDQHSLQQMFLDGPADKGCIQLHCPNLSKGPQFPDDVPDSWEWLRGKTFGDLLNAETLGSAAALVHNGVPLTRLEAAESSMRAAGEVMGLLMATTVLTGWLMNINPLDQPAVELGKRLAYSRLGSSSYPEEAAILKAFLD